MLAACLRLSSALKAEARHSVQWVSHTKKKDCSATNPKLNYQISLHSDLSKRATPFDAEEGGGDDEGY